ncbi:Gfo/Idh/MocA family protein [Pseudaquabacterium rugosum]|uniref:Gfo/Idh/MocA family oxidoreductase n=1 Tax=Pseudaquabacterium rugosum TaxID=2984194 RepID=A0ABU9BE79_9BURK
MITNTTAPRRLRYAMVGGGRDSFIGVIHRHAMALDSRYELVAGAFSSTPEKGRASGRDLGLADARNHGTWQALLADELTRSASERVDLVCIVTPNHVHYDVAHAFVDAGFHVVCDKPLVHTSAQAQCLVDLVARRGTLFGVTYNYSGYPMVRQAREMVRTGQLGTLRKVIVEYNQSWLTTQVQSKQADWRTDPARTGIAGAIGDIGTHAEQLAATVTGLEIESICADLTRFVPGRQVDDDGSLLLRFKGGARGVLMASQIAAGAENDLRLRVIGDQGSLMWRQEDPNRLIHTPLGGPLQVLTRGSAWLHDAATQATRTPAGHPEAFIEAFANIYAGVANDLQARLQTGQPASRAQADYPRVDEGARGVRFIEKTVESSRSTLKWTEIDG